DGKIEDQEYFLLEPNAWLDSLGTISFATLLQLDPGQVPAHAGNRALHIVDEQTLILADLAPLKQFLAVKRRFPPKAQPKEVAPKEGEAPEDPASQARGAPMPRGRGAPPAGPAGGDAGAAEGEPAPPPPSGAYLTV